MRRTLTIITALVALTALAVPASGFAAKNKTVKVRDDFFSPTSVKVKKDAKVKFNWGSTNINTHNAHHGGQIVLLRKLQGSWDSKGGVS